MSQRLPVWAVKPKHKKTVVVTPKGWALEETGELLVRVRDLDQKLAEYGITLYDEEVIGDIVINDDEEDIVLVEDETIITVVEEEDVVIVVDEEEAPVVVVEEPPVVANVVETAVKKKPGRPKKVKV